MNLSPKMTVPQVLSKKTSSTTFLKLSCENAIVKTLQIMDSDAVIPYNIQQRIGCKILKLDLALNQATIQYKADNTIFTEIVPAKLPRLNANMAKFLNLVFYNPQILFVDHAYYDLSAIQLKVKRIPENYLSEFRTFSKQFMAERNSSFEGDMLPQVASYQSQLVTCHLPFQETAAAVHKKLEAKFWLQHMKDKNMLTDNVSKLAALKLDQAKARLVQLYLDEQFIEMARVRIQGVFAQPLMNMTSVADPIVKVVCSLEGGKLHFQTSFDYYQLEKRCGPFVSKPIMHLIQHDSAINEKDLSKAEFKSKLDNFYGMEKITENRALLQELGMQDTECYGVVVNFQEILKQMNGDAILQQATVIATGLCQGLQPIDESASDEQLKAYKSRVLFQKDSVAIGYMKVQLSQAKEKLLEHFGKIEGVMQSRKNAEFGERLKTIYMDIAARDACFDQAITTPAQLVVLSRTQQELPKFLREVRQSLFGLIDSAVERGYLFGPEAGEEEVTLEVVLRELVGLGRRRHFSSTALERDFSKLLIDLVELMDHYSGQVEMMAQDCQKMDPANTDQLTTKKLTRWLYNGFTYRSIEKFFDVADQRTFKFVDSVREESGIDLQSFDQNEFRYVKGEQFNVGSAVKELIYVCGAMQKIYNVATTWGQVLKTRMFITLDPNKLFAELKPIADLMLGVDVLNQSWDDYQAHQIRDIDTSRMIDSANQILQSIQVIKKLNFTGWLPKAETTLETIKQLYPKLLIVKMLQSPHLTSFHHSKMSQIIGVPITSDLDTKLFHITRACNDDRFAYVFENVNKVLQNAEKNTEYKNIITKMSKFIADVQIERIPVSRNVSAAYHQFYYIRFHGDLDCLKVCNQYILELAQLIQMDLNPLTQQLLREVEQSIVFTRQYGVFSSRSSVMISQFLEQETTYNKINILKELQKLTVQMLLLQEQFYGKIKSEGVPLAFIKNQALFSQFSDALEQFEKIIYYPKPPLTDSMLLTKKNTPPNLQEEFKRAMESVRQNKFEELLENYCYQTVIHAIAFIDFTLLPKVLDVLNNVTEKMKAKGDTYLKAIQQRVKELSRPEQVMITTCQKQHSFNQRMIQDAIGVSRDFWLGDVQQLETNYLSEESYQCIFEAYQATRVGVPLILMASRICKYERVEVMWILMFLSRILGQKFTIFTLGPGMNQEEIQSTITEYILKSYTVMLCGTEYLTVSQMNTLLLLTTNLQNKSGAFSQSQNLGGIIFFLPTLAQSLNYGNSEMLLTSQTTNVLKMFEARREVLYKNDMACNFSKFTEHNKEMQEVSVILSCVSSLIPNVRAQNIPFIKARIKQDTKIAFANSVFCFIIHQVHDKSLESSIKNIISSAFNLQPDDIQNNYKQFKETKQHDMFTQEGNFYFELAQFFVRQNLTAIVSHSKPLRHLIIETLCKVNKWRVFWITNVVDFENQLIEIQKDPQNSLLVFVAEQITGIFTQSIYQHIITSICPNQPYFIAGQYYYLPNIKVVMLMQNYNDPMICETPLQLVFNKVFFDCDQLNQDYIMKNQVLTPLSNIPKSIKPQQITTIKECQQIVIFQATYQSQEDLTKLEEKNKLKNELEIMLHSLIDSWVEKCHKNLKIFFKITTWQIFRTLLLLEMREVGMVTLLTTAFHHQEPPKNLDTFLTTAHVETNQFTGLKFIDFVIENAEINFDFFEFTDYLSQRTKIQLSIFCCIMNSIIIIANCEWGFSSDIQRIAQIIVDSCNNNEQLTDSAKSLLTQQYKPPKTAYEYIRYGILQRDEDSQDSQDSFMEDDTNLILELRWYEYKLGQDRYKKPAILKFLQSEVDYEPNLWLSPRQVASSVFLASLIIGNFSCAITGPDQIGKTTLFNAAISIISDLVVKESYVFTKAAKYEDLVQRITLQLRLNSKSELQNVMPQQKIIHIQMVNNGFQFEYSRDTFDFLVDQKTIFLKPHGYDQIIINLFKNCRNSGISQLTNSVVLLEINELPPSLKTSVKQVNVQNWDQNEVKQYIKQLDSKISDLDLKDFVTGIFLIFPVLNCSLPMLFNKMYKFITFITKDDNCQRGWSITAFMNALREIPHINNENIQQIIDTVETALSVGVISRNGFWGGLDINNMIQLQVSDLQMFNRIQYHQYTSWELETLQACQDACEQLDDSDDDEKSDQKKDDKRKSSLEFMKASGKFRHSMIMRSDLKGIDHTIYNLYVASYKEFGNQLDPNLCNRMLQMHIIVQSDLERNACRLFEYYSALRSCNYHRIQELQNRFRIPIYVFYSQHMPANQYINQIQLLATLGNYQISNLKLFAQINAKLKDEEVSINTSDTSDTSSVHSASSSSSFSLSVSSASQHQSLNTVRDKQVYNHKVHGRSQRRILIDIETLIQQMMKDIKERNDTKKDKHKFDDQLIEALSQRLQDQGESSLAGYILRAAFCQSIGISPVVGLQDLNLREPLQVSPGGQVLPKFPTPNDVIHHVRDVLKQQNSETFKCDDQNLQNLVRYNIIQDQIDVMTVVPMSRLIQGNDTHTMLSLMQLANPNTAAITMFSEQEMKVLGLLVAYNSGFDFIPTTQQILCIASRSFAVMIINDVNATHWQRIPSTPTARHQVIEQKLNAKLSGKRDSILLAPLFKMSRVPLVNMEKIGIPTYVIETAMLKRQTQYYCKAVLAVYEFCENNCIDNHPSPSLNSFAKYCKKIICDRIHHSKTILGTFEPLIETMSKIEEYQDTQKYTGKERDQVLKLHDNLTTTKDILHNDYLRQVEFLKNVIADGVMIAARFLFFQYINPEFKSEKLFEIGLIDALKNEQITNISISSHDTEADSDQKLQSVYDCFGHTKQNISGVTSQLMGLLLEQFVPHWDYTPCLSAGLLKQNFLQEVTQLITARRLQLQFPLLRDDISYQAMIACERYLQQTDLKTIQESIIVVNCILPNNQFCLEAQTAIQSGKTILFKNFGTMPENTSILQELLLLVINKITKKNQPIKIGGVRVIIPKPLHHYGIYFSLKEGVSVADMVSLGVFGMQICDTGILISPPFKVLDTQQIILEQLDKANFHLVLQDSVAQLSTLFKQYIVDVKFQDVSRFNEQRKQQKKAYALLADTKQIFEANKLFIPGQFKFQDAEKIISIFGNISQVMQDRVSIMQQITDQSKFNRATTQLARAMTCCYLATAQFAKFQSALGVIFIDNLWHELGAYIKQHQTKNVQSDVILGVMPYFLSKVLPLIPKNYHIQILAISYSMYMVAFDMAESSDLELIRHLYQVTYDGQKRVQQHAIENIDMTKYKSLKRGLLPPIFNVNKRLTNSWQCFLSTNQFTHRFDELFGFYEHNYAKFAELVLNKSSIDRILGNYLITSPAVAQQLIPKLVQDQLEKKVLALPFTMEQLNLKSIWSVCVCSLMAQTENGINTMRRYSQLVPISPEQLLAQQTTLEKFQHKEQVKKFGLFRGMYSEIASKLCFMAHKAMEKSKVLLVFHDAGMAIQEMCIFIQILLLEQRYICTINPSIEQLQDLCVIQTTNHDVVGSLTNIENMWKDGQSPSHLLWVLVPQAWNNKVGQENIDSNNKRIDIAISNFCATTECDCVYIQKPQTFHETLSYYVTMGCGQFMRNNINVMTLKEEVQSIFFGLAQQYAKRVSKGQDGVVDIDFVLQIRLLIDRLQSNKPIYTEHFKTPASLPIFSAEDGKISEERPQRFAKITQEMPEVASMESTTKLWLACEEENAVPVYDELLNQELQVLPPQNEVKIFRDGLQFIVNKQFYSVFTDEKIGVKLERANLDVIPKTLQDITKYAINNKQLRFEVHGFTHQDYDVVELQKELRFRAAAFYPVLGEIFYFAKIMNQPVTKAALHEMRVIVLLEPPTGHYEISGTKIRPSKTMQFYSFDQVPSSQVQQQDPVPYLFFKVEDARFRNCSYDAEAQSICDVCDVEAKGFWYYQTLYVTVATLSQEAFDKSVDFEGNALTGIQFVGNGCANRPYVYVKDKTGLGDEGWAAKGAHVGIGYF